MIKLRARRLSRAPGLHQDPLRGAFSPSCPNSGTPLPRKQRSPDIARLKELRGGLCGHRTSRENPRSQDRAP